jgi:hypothetical protein
VRSGPAAPAHRRTAAAAPAARTAARTPRRPHPHPASVSRPHPATRPLRRHHPGRHHRGTLIGLGQHPTRVRLGDPHPEVPGPPAGGHLEAVHSAGTHTALLDPELRERRRQEPRVVAVEVGDQAVDQGRRRRHGPLGHHPQLAHPPAPAPASGRKAAVSTTTQVTIPLATSRPPSWRRTANSSRRPATRSRTAAISNSARPRWEPDAPAQPGPRPWSPPPPTPLRPRPPWPARPEPAPAGSANTGTSPLPTATAVSASVYQKVARRPSSSVIGQPYAAAPPLGRPCTSQHQGRLVTHARGA